MQGQKTGSSTLRGHLIKWLAKRWLVSEKSLEMPFSVEWRAAAFKLTELVSDCSDQRGYCGDSIIRDYSFVATRWKRRIKWGRHSAEQLVATPSDKSGRATLCSLHMHFCQLFVYLTRQSFTLLMQDAHAQQARNKQHHDGSCGVWDFWLLADKRRLQDNPNQMLK